MDVERSKALLDDLRKSGIETEWIEFKENNSDPQMIGKNVSAIANSARLADRQAGYIVWGVRDSDHAVVGTTFDPYKAKKGNQPLPLWLSQQIDPDIHLNFIHVDHDAGKVILLEIPAAVGSPVSFERNVYVRVGNSTTLLDSHRGFQSRLWSKLQSHSWENGLAAAFLSAEGVLDRLDYTSYFEMTAQPLPESREGIFEKLSAEGIVQPDVGGRWSITNIGAVLFAKRLDEFERLGRKGVRVIEYEGSDRTKTRRRQDGKRGYANGFESLVTYINGLLPLNEHIGAAFRTEARMYPEIAIRELVANALIHQDFTISGAGPMVEIFSDRIEITNPGAPLNDPKRLIDLPPRSRNEKVAALMRRMRVCEEQGSGLDKVVSSAEVYQLPPPDFRVEADNMRAVLFAPRQFANMTAAERLRATYQHSVIKFLTGDRLTNASLRMRFGIEDQNAAQVSRVLRDAMNAGLIKLADPDSPRAGYIPFWA